MIPDTNDDILLMTNIMAQMNMLGVQGRVDLLVLTHREPAWQSFYNSPVMVLLAEACSPSGDGLPRPPGDRVPGGGSPGPPGSLRPSGCLWSIWIPKAHRPSDRLGNSLTLSALNNSVLDSSIAEMNRYVIQLHVTQHGANKQLKLQASQKLMLMLSSV